MSLKFASRLVQVLSGMTAGLLLFPGPALAFGPLWVTQGSYVHQIAHLLFAVAMFFFIYQIHREDLRQFRGFRYLAASGWFFAIWNLDAMVGHVSEWTLANPVFLGKGLSTRLLMYDSNTWLFYITQIDHYVLLAPAFYLFYRGLKAFALEPESRP